MLRYDCRQLLTGTSDTHATAKFNPRGHFIMLTAHAYLFEFTILEHAWSNYAHAHTMDTTLSFQLVRSLGSRLMCSQLEEYSTPYMVSTAAHAWKLGHNRPHRQPLFCIRYLVYISLQEGSQSMLITSDPYIPTSSITIPA